VLTDHTPPNLTIVLRVRLVVDLARVVSHLAASVPAALKLKSLMTTILIFTKALSREALQLEEESSKKINNNNKCRYNRLTRTQRTFKTNRQLSK
jgi:hypothetical protein